MITLVSHIESQLPKKDNTRYNVALDRIDWNSVCFDTHSAEDCKKAALAVMQNVRKHRTLTEMIGDAKNFALNPHRSMSTGHISHPDKPKKPMTPFFRFFTQKRAKFHEEYPEMSNLELTKHMSAEFNLLSPKKQKRYKDPYYRELAVYKSNSEAFRQEHPECYKKKRHAPEHVGPEKPRRPFDLYSARRMKKYEGEDKKVALEKIRESWTNLSEEKKLKWIKKAVRDSERYDNELAEYMKEHPEFEPPKKRANISKSELDLKYKSEGRPAKPPSSGYMLYTKTMLKEIGGGKEKMAQIAKQWKELSEDERTKYSEKAQKGNTKYLKKFEAFVRTLPEEEQTKLVGPKRGPKANNPGTKRKRKMREEVLQNNARLAFQLNELNKLRAKFPDKANGELIISVNKNWDKLDEQGKGEYQRMAESLKEFMFMDEPKVILTEFEPPKKDDATKDFCLKSGVKKPPKNGFALFCSEKISTFPNVAPKDRMKIIADLWKGKITATEKDSYIARSKEQNDAFKEQFDHYKQTGEISRPGSLNKKPLDKAMEAALLKMIKPEPISSTEKTSSQTAYAYLYHQSSDDDSD